MGVRCLISQSRSSIVRLAGVIPTPSGFWKVSPILSVVWGRTILNQLAHSHELAAAENNSVCPAATNATLGVDGKQDENSEEASKTDAEGQAGLYAADIRTFVARVFL